MTDVPAPEEDEDMGDAQKASTIEDAVEAMLQELDALSVRNQEVNANVMQNLDAVRSAKSEDVAMSDSITEKADQVLQGARETAKALVTKHIHEAIRQADELIADEPTRRQAIKDLMSNIESSFEHQIKPLVTKAEQDMRAEMPTIRAQQEAVAKDIITRKLVDAAKKDEQIRSDKLQDTIKQQKERLAAQAQKEINRVEKREDKFKDFEASARERREKEEEAFERRREKKQEAFERRRQKQVERIEQRVEKVKEQERLAREWRKQLAEKKQAKGKKKEDQQLAEETEPEDQQMAPPPLPQLEAPPRPPRLEDPRGAKRETLDAAEQVGEGAPKKKRSRRT